MLGPDWRNVLGIAAVLVATGPVWADEDDAREMQRATAAAKVMLAQAIEIAEREVSGGKAVEVKLEWKRNGPRIEVELVAGNMWKEVEIDAVTGRVLKVIDEPADERDEQEELKRDKENVQAATVGFTDAIATAEKDAGGKAVDVELTTTAGKPTYKIKLLVDNKFVTQRVPATQAK
jgi:uncharacterized membrane protein YkoI